MRNCLERNRLGLLAAVVLPCVAWGLHVTVSPMVAEFADTEVSTNIVFNRARSDVRELAMSFVFEGVPSCCIQVAFGRDADGDGVLSFDETDAVYGWRNGRHFAEDVRACVRTEEPEPATGSPLTMRLRLTKSARPELFAATNGTGGAVLDGLALSVPTWLYRPEWNLIRMTRRGADVPAEWFVCDVRYNEFFFIVR